MTDPARRGSSRRCHQLRMSVRARIGLRPRGIISQLNAIGINRTDEKPHRKRHASMAASTPDFDKQPVKIHIRTGSMLYEDPFDERKPPGDSATVAEARSALTTRFSWACRAEHQLGVSNPRSGHLASHISGRFQPCKCRARSSGQQRSFRMSALQRRVMFQGKSRVSFRAAIGVGKPISHLARGLLHLGREWCGFAWLSSVFTFCGTGSPWPARTNRSPARLAEWQKTPDHVVRAHAPAGPSPRHNSPGDGHRRQVAWYRSVGGPGRTSRVARPPEVLGQREADLGLVAGG